MLSREEYGLEEVSLWTPWRQFNSTNLAAARYHPGIFKLQVVFVNGRKYEYEDVEPGTWDKLISSTSPGKFFYNAVREFGYISREM